MSKFRHRVATYLYKNFLRTTSYKTAMKSLYSVTVSQSIYFLASNGVFFRITFPTSVHPFTATSFLIVSFFSSRFSFFSELLQLPSFLMSLAYQFSDRKRPSFLFLLGSFSFIHHLFLPLPLQPLLLTGIIGKDIHHHHIKIKKISRKIILKKQKKRIN